MAIKEGLFQRIRAIPSGDLYLGGDAKVLERISRSGLSLQDSANTTNEIDSIIYGTDSIYVADDGETLTKRDASDLSASTSRTFSFLPAGTQTGMMAFGYNDDIYILTGGLGSGGTAVERLSTTDLSTSASRSSFSQLDSNANLILLSVTQTPDNVFVLAVEEEATDRWIVVVYTLATDTLAEKAVWRLDPNGDINLEAGVKRVLVSGNNIFGEIIHSQNSSAYFVVEPLSESFDNNGSIETQDAGQEIRRLDPSTNSIAALAEFDSDTNPEPAITAGDGGAIYTSTTLDDDSVKKLDESDLSVISTVNANATGQIEFSDDGHVYMRLTTAIDKIALDGSGIDTYSSANYGTFDEILAFAVSPSIPDIVGADDTG